MDNTSEFKIETILANDIDTLVVKGVQYIKAHGSRIQATAGPALQAYAVNYVLLDSRNRIHSLRHPESVRYFCRELLAYFQGSRNVEDGLAQASGFWRTLADGRGFIQSNYGYYVFYQRIHNSTQYEWIVSNLRKNPQTRKALCNINQPEHKNPTTKDFPCVIAAQFFVQNLRLCCEVFSRSEDVVTGLPYDLGFFSFVNELICADLNRTADRPFELGHTVLRCSFTQIYDRTAAQAERMLAKSFESPVATVRMPPIDDVEKTIEDIYSGARTSNVMRWIFNHAQF
jgi:thymidylate synthase